MVLHKLPTGRLTLTINSQSRALEVLFDPEMTRDTLLEFKQLLEWCFDKIEISTVLFKPRHPQNPITLEANQLRELSAPQVMELRQHCYELNLLMMRSSQTLILDAGSGIHHWAFDVFAACDYMTGHRSGFSQWNYASFGMMPLTAHLIGFRHYDQLVIQGAVLSHRELAATFLLRDLYDESDRDFVLNRILAQISFQRPVTRIQTKLLLRHALVSTFEAAFRADRSIFLAGLSAQEWLLEEGVDLPSYLKNFKQSLLAATQETTQPTENAQVIPFRRKDREASLN